MPPRLNTTGPITRAEEKRRTAAGIPTPFHGEPSVNKVFCGEPSVGSLLCHFLSVFTTLTIGKAKANSDPDTLNWDQAMKSPYRENFLEATDIEINALVGKGTWYEDRKSSATSKIIPSQWVFRIKRTPDGSIKKFKARLVLRGDLQDDDGSDNYSPVAAWTTVRSFLMVSIQKGYITVTIDFSNAFVQSKLPEDQAIWMHVPQGYVSTNGPDHCLRLVKSLYGLNSAPTAMV